MAKLIKILFVDDDPAITNLLGAKLAKYEHLEIEMTNDPGAALALAKRFEPDVAVLDIDMGSTDGGALSDAFKAHPSTRDIPVLFLTSLVTKDQEKANHGVIGGRNMMSKRTTVPKLVERIEAMLENA